MFLSFHVTAQEEKLPTREVYQATAMGQLTQMGKTFNVTINIDQYSSSDDRQVLVDAFGTSGSQGLYNAVEKMHAKGRVAITGTLGYDVDYIRRIPNADGYTIRLLTNRPIRIGEAWANGRSMSYNLTFIELKINNDSSKSTGVLMPAVRFVIDKKTGEVVADNYQNPWKLQNIVNRSKE